MDNRCVVCGEVIPEGRMVCPRCENREKLIEKEQAPKKKRGMDDSDLMFCICLFIAVFMSFAISLLLNWN